eukprot:6197912-Pleurochrysis_carterae.AAC.1
MTAAATETKLLERWDCVAFSTGIFEPITSVVSSGPPPQPAAPAAEAIANPEVLEQRPEQ